MTAPKLVQKNTFLKASLRSVAIAVLASYYRCSHSRSTSPRLLEALGIAHPNHAPRFYTLAKAVDSIVEPGAVIIECGVYWGYTLLGMAHRLASRGMRARIIGCDSFAGFPDPSHHDRRPDGTFHPVARKGHFGDTSFEKLQKKIVSLGFDNVIELRKGVL